MQPIILAISTMCQNLAFSNFGVIGSCFVEFMLFNDFTLAALMLLSVFVGFIVRYNLPGTLILPISVLLSYALYIVSGGSQIFMFLFLLTLVINGVLIVLGLLNYSNR